LRLNKRLFLPSPEQASHLAVVAVVEEAVECVRQDEEEEDGGPGELEEGLGLVAHGEHAEEAQAIEDGDGGIEGAREYADGGEDEDELGEAGVGLAKRKGF